MNVSRVWRSSQDQTDASRDLDKALRRVGLRAYGSEIQRFQLRLCLGDAKVRTLYIDNFTSGGVFSLESQ